MLKEAIDSIIQLADSRRKPVKLDVSKNESVSHYLMPGGEVKEFDHTPEDLYLLASTVDSFVDAVHKYSHGPASVWVNAMEIVGVLNDGGVGTHRDNRVAMAIEWSPLISYFEKLGSRTFQQKDLIRELRTVLNGCAINPAHFEQLIRNLKFATRDEESGEFTGNQSDSLGRSVQAEVMGTEELPRTVRFDFTPLVVPAMADINVTIECSFIADPSDRRLTLTPVIGHVEYAKQLTLEILQAMLVERLDTKHPVYLGTP